MASQLPAPPRTSSYHMMLNSFAEDLESILSDLSGSASPLPTIHEDTPLLEPEVLAPQEPTTPPSPDVGSSSNLGSGTFPQSLNESIASTSRSCSPETLGECNSLTLLERLIRTHSIWFLPDLQRAGAVHLLQNQEETGLFLVRQSSQPGTLALSIRLESDETGGDIQHYLLETVRLDNGNTGVRLEASELVFDSLPVLFEHYSQCCDELPVQLRLPRRLREAKTRQALAAYALLGQDFWARPFGLVAPESPPELSPRVARTKQPPPPPPRWAKPTQMSALPSTCSSSSENLANMVTETELSVPVNNLAPVLECKNNDSEPEVLVETLPTANPNVENTTTTTVTTTTVTTEETKEVIHIRTRNSVIEANIHVENGQMADSQCQQNNNNNKGKRKFRRRRQCARSPDGKPYHSSAADKASDYEDIWDSPPREMTSPAGPDSDLEPAESDPTPAPIPKTVSVEALISFDEDAKVVNPAPSLPNPSPIDALLDCHDLTTTALLVKAKETTEEDILQELVTQDDTAIGDTLDLQEDSLLRPDKRDSHRASKRASPLYSEPADALPKQRHPYHITRPLPPFPAPEHFRIPGFHQQPVPSSFTSYLTNPAPPVLQLRPLPVPLSSERFVINNNNRRQTANIHKKNHKNAFRFPLPLKALSSHAAAGNSNSAHINPQKITNISWPVDSSWEFLNTDVPHGLENTLPMSGKFFLKSPASLAKPPHLPFPAPGVDLPEQYGFSNLTMRHVLTALRPDLTLPVANYAPPPSPTPSSASHSRRSLESRKSAYDNWASDQLKKVAEKDEEDDVGTETEFSEPWDSSRWTQLLNARESLSNGSGNVNGSLTPTRTTPGLFTMADFSKNTLSDAGIGTLSDCATWSKGHVETRKKPPRPPLQRTKSFKDKMDPLIASPRLLALRGSERTEAGRRLRSAVLALGQDPSTTFCQNIRHFVQCTREAREARPSVVARNVRQFMSGLKNFLLQHGEKLFDAALDDEQKRLKPTEFLNLGAILESCLQTLVLVPLHPHLYALFVQDSLEAGKLQNMALAIESVREMDPVTFGLRADCDLPSAELLDRVGQSMYLMQAAPCPLDKLEHLLAATTDIYYHATSAYGDNLSADEFLPLLAWVCARCGMVTAELEADFMWALLQPALLAGEGAYFLTALSSALQLLHGFRLPASPPGSPGDEASDMGTWRSGRTSEGSPIPCVLRVLVADESQGSLLARTVPVRPGMTARDVSKLLALKLRLSNPQDYGLVALIDGQETLMNESDSPHSLRTSILSSGRNCTFAFRRLDAKIAWPSHLES